MKFLTSIDLSQNEIQNAIMQPLAAPPANPKIGQIYFNSIDLTLYLWTGEKWIPVPTKTSQLENDSGFITSGDIPEGAAASTTTPKMNGTAAVGTEMAFARGDHVHPKRMNTIDITPIVNAALALIGAGVSVFLIPWLKKQTTEAQRKELTAWVKIGVAAAEQLYVGQGRGEEKKQYVLDFLKQKGFKVDEESVVNAIEAIVKQLNTEGLTIE